MSLLSRVALSSFFSALRSVRACTSRGFERVQGSLLVLTASKKSSFLLAISQRQRPNVDSCPNEMKILGFPSFRDSNVRTKGSPGDGSLDHLSSLESNFQRLVRLSLADVTSACASEYFLNSWVSQLRMLEMELDDGWKILWLCLRR